jgi:tRNA(Ile)-lysidine synthetase-like protein
LQWLRLGQAPEFDLVERLRARAGEPVAVGPEQWVSRDAGGLLRIHKIEAPNFDKAKRSIVLTSKSSRLEFGGLALAWEIVEAGHEGRPDSAAHASKPRVEYFDADKVGRKILLRHWQPGDRFHPIGMKASRKLQDLFTDLKVPRDERHRRIVAATSAGELFWVEGLRMAEGFKLEPDTVRRLRWEWRRT